MLALVLIDLRRLFDLLDGLAMAPKLSPADDPYKVPCKLDGARVTRAIHRMCRANIVGCVSLPIPQYGD